MLRFVAVPSDVHIAGIARSIANSGRKEFTIKELKKIEIDFKNQAP